MKWRSWHGQVSIALGVGLGCWFSRGWWDSLVLWIYRWWQVVLVVSLIATGVAILHTRPRDPRSDTADEMRPLSTRSIVTGAMVLVALAVVIASLLLRAFGGGSPTVQLDAIRTAGTIVVGTGGAAALWLAARRQRSTELSLAHQRVVAAQSEHDALERRITDLYTKAVEQLGSDQAPVRLGGLYALDRLGGSTPEQRETIFNVVCAYLRMPFPPEPNVVDADASAEEREKFDKHLRERLQERQVRLTAQRILHRHRLPGTDDWWEVSAIDLRAAALGGANLAGADLRGADLDEADLSAADLTGVHLGGATLVGADLTGASLTGARLEKVNGENLDLTAMGLAGVDLREARLANATLTRADLHNADLTGADLQHADLVGADLRSARLVDASLAGADLTDANLDGAVVTGTSFDQVKVTRTILTTSLSPEQLVEINRKKPQPDV
ncbi:pentapeptide repeat-containing protein [Saccharothrix variisporea]|uniref:Uncharacterized protein YjbI with pentapeptide repeats n=1 Tax=Saccharothrix variisporea TaxID=543527 RepID=A0A495X8S7_9PSEU|nr:pentapeptide repeat-containing protein [Saccharothrix variisporea]RKT70019.1 uncharacterized protein YjbI with pentapeptide repeats [Saccharothrix variisporea]